jgi:hypothetical protein
MLRNVDQMAMVATMTTASHRTRFLMLAGGGLSAIGALGIGLTTWFGGFNPSRWFIITAAGVGRAISGWTITTALSCTFFIGLFLLVLAHREKRLRQ